MTRGPLRVANPSVHDSLIRNTSPVYPGASATSALNTAVCCLRFPRFIVVSPSFRSPHHFTQLSEFRGPLQWKHGEAYDPKRQAVVTDKT
jgi:hypothetical protein